MSIAGTVNVSISVAPPFTHPFIHPDTHSLTRPFTLLFYTYSHPFYTYSHPFYSYSHPFYSYSNNVSYTIPHNSTAVRGQAVAFKFDESPDGSPNGSLVSQDSENEDKEDRERDKDKDKNLPPPPSSFGLGGIMRKVGLIGSSPSTGQHRPNEPGQQNRHSSLDNSEPPDLENGGIDDDYGVFGFGTAGADCSDEQFVNPMPRRRTQVGSDCRYITVYFLTTLHYITTMLST